MTRATADDLPIPNDTSEVTSDWLDGVLRATGTIEKSRVVSVETRVVPAGTGGGFFSDVIWLYPTYEPNVDSAPAGLVLKRPRPAADALLMSRYEREVNFYRHFASSSPAQTPRCFFAKFDQGTGTFALLFEDLSDLKPGDELHGCSLEEAGAAVVNLARHHAVFWERQGLDAVLTSRLTPWRPPTPEMWSKMESDFTRRLPAVLSRVISGIQTHLPDLMQRMAQPPHTLLHGDFRLDNLLFAPDSQLEPLQVVFLDWQMARGGRGPADLAWLLGLAIDTQNRREWQHVLLRTYHDELTRNGVSGYDFSDCLRDYRTSLLTTMCSVALGYWEAPAEGRAAEKFEQFVLRASNAVADNDSLSLLTPSGPSSAE